MTYLGELYVSFRRVGGAPGTFIGLAVSLIAFYVVPQATVGWRHVIVGMVVVSLALLVLIDASFRLHNRNRSPLPRILRALAPTPAHSNCIALLLLEPSEWFGQQAVVSIFYLRDGFEVLVALGEVIHVQEDRKIQVLVRQAIDENDRELWTSVLGNDTRVLQELIIKPSLPANIPIARIPNGRITS